jgi:hypothetical protein
MSNDIDPPEPFAIYLFGDELPLERLPELFAAWPGRPTRPVLHEDRGVEQSGSSSGS